MRRAIVLGALLAAGCPKVDEPAPAAPDAAAAAPEARDAAFRASIAPADAELAPDAPSSADAAAAAVDASPAPDSALPADATMPDTAKPDTAADVRVADLAPEGPAECATGSDCPTGCCAGVTATHPIGTCGAVSECAVAGELAEGSYQVVLCRTSVDSFAGDDGLYIGTQACPDDVGVGDVHATLTWYPSKRLVFENQVVCRVLTIGFVPPALRGNIPPCMR